MTLFIKEDISMYMYFITTADFLNYTAETRLFANLVLATEHFLKQKKKVLETASQVLYEKEEEYSTDSYTVYFGKELI
ncbi:hypothetical protein HMPREF0556_plasmid12610 (plasmid) [Listeria grayi DSM 20601]|uniref:Uncharacterized protein n=2 Tax=Listeria grayi TaxID=1641 RepID=D7V1I5_LISGR|nr:hypothetical protein HMPREF0556_plasmid12610 [Listeria grayi DSM 20601]